MAISVAQFKNVYVLRKELLPDSPKIVLLTKYIVSSEELIVSYEDIDVKHHFVRGVFDAGTVDMKHVGTNSMTADIFTKELVKPKIEVNSTAMELFDDIRLDYSWQLLSVL